VIIVSLLYPLVAALLAVGFFEQLQDVMRRLGLTEHFAKLIVSQLPRNIL
jgi:hypothetical protein